MSDTSHVTSDRTGEIRKVEFVRDSDHARDFDGRWQVWIGSRYFGIVRKSAYPLRTSWAWGFESVPFGRYPNGQQCDQGFPTRAEAAHSLIGRVVSCDIGGPT